MKKLYLLALSILCLVKANGQVGELDPAFANKGIQLTAFSKKNRLSEDGRSLLRMANGDFFVVFQVINSNTTVTVISRYLSNGTIDSSYGNEGYSTPVSISGASAVMQGNKIIVAGTVLFGDFGLARYNPDGSLDSTFGGVGLVTTDFNGRQDEAHAVAIQNDNIIVAGSSNSPFGFNNDFALARYTADGFLDSSFSQDGIVITEFNGKDDIGQSIAIQNGKIIVAGYTVVIDSLYGYYKDDFAVARYNFDGSPDSSFGNNGLVTTDFNGGKDNAQSVAIQGDRIVVAGYTSSYTTNAVNLALARYNLNGSLDSTFSGDGILTSDFAGWRESYAYSIAFQDDKIVIAGQVAGSDSLGYSRDGFAVIRYNSTGSLDSSFGKDGLVATEFGFFEAAHSIVIQGNKILLVGTTYNGSENDFAITQYNADGSVDSTFNEDGLVIGYYPSGETYFTCAVMQGEKILVGGYINNNIINNSFLIARYNPDGSLDSTFNGNGFVTKDFGNFSASIQSIALQGDKIVVAGSTYPFNDFAIARYNSNGSLDSTFSEDGVVTTDFNGWDDNAASVVVQDNKIIVAGSAFNFDTYDNDFAIARYNLDGSLDSTFNGNGRVTTDFSGLDDYAQSIVVQNGKIVVAGSTRDFFSNYNFAVARYNSNGSLDSSFNNHGLVVTDFTGTNDFAGSVALQGNNIVVAGNTDDAFAPREGFAIARYKSNGSLDSSFNNNGLVTTYFDRVAESRSVVIEGDKIIVGGTSSPGTSINNFAIARYNKNGSLDSTFSEDGLQITGKGGNSYSLQKIVLNGNRLYAVGNNQLSGIITFGAIAAYQLQESVMPSCPADRTLHAAEGVCTAVVNGIDPVLSPLSNFALVNYTLSGATVGCGKGTACGKTFNLGTTLVTYSLAADPHKTCSFEVTIVPAKEQCNGKDDNCDGQVDEGCPCLPFITVNDVTVNESKGSAIVTVTLSKKTNEPVFIMYYTEDGTAKSKKRRQMHFFNNTSDNQQDYVATGGILTVPAGVQTTAITVPVINDGVAEMDEYFHVRLLYAFNATIANHESIVIIKDGTHLAPGLMDNKVKKGVVTNEQPSVQLGIEAYPNPSETGFTIQIKGNDYKQPVSVIVYDISGRIIEQKKNIAVGKSIWLGDHYVAGTYLIEAVQGKEKVSTRVVKHDK